MKLGVATGIAFVMGCLPASAVTVPVGPGTDYPCGVHGKVCSAESGGGCCDADQEICGHDHSSADEDPTDTCPAGECCDVGPNQDEAPPYLMMHRQAPKR